MRTIGMNHGGSKAVRCSRHSQLDTKVKWVRLGPAVYESLGVWALVKTLAAPCLPAVLGHPAPLLVQFGMCAAIDYAVRLRLARDVTRINPLCVVDTDRLDHALLLQLLNSCPSQRTVDLQALDKRRRCNKLHL